MELGEMFNIDHLSADPPHTIYDFQRQVFTVDLVQTLISWQSFMIVVGDLKTFYIFYKC